MLRRNPDAAALIVIGLFALALSVPRMLFRDAHWAVTPLSTEIRAQEPQVRAVRSHLEAERQAMKARTESIRRSLRLKLHRATSLRGFEANRTEF